MCVTTRSSHLPQLSHHYYCAYVLMNVYMCMYACETRCLCVCVRFNALKAVKRKMFETVKSTGTANCKSNETNGNFNQVTHGVGGVATVVAISATNQRAIHSTIAYR